MHEISLASDMIEAVSERMRDFPGSRVRRIVLRIGRDSGVVPEAMRFCFELCVAGTVAEGAALEVERPEGSELKIAEMEID